MKKKLLPLVIILGISALAMPFVISELESKPSNFQVYPSDEDESPSHGGPPILISNYKEVSIITIPLGASNTKNQNFIPENITVILGKNNTVTWINQDDTIHGFVSDDGTWGTGMLLPNQEFTIVFTEPGIFEYHGQPHPWETGKIIVKEIEKRIVYPGMGGKMLALNILLDDCAFKAKLEANGGGWIGGEGREFQNSTHYIDNNDCKWIRHWDGYSHPFGYEPDYTENFEEDYEIDFTEKFD